MFLGKLITLLMQSIAGKLHGGNHKFGNASLSDLTREDKQLFEALSQFTWIQGDPIPLIFNVNDAVYVAQGITLSGLERLEALGLIILEANGFVKKGLGKYTRLFYCGKPTKIGFQNDANNTLDLGHVLLTEQGKHLLPLTEQFRNQQFYEYIIQRWFRQGLILSSIQIDRT